MTHTSTASLPPLDDIVSRIKHYSPRTLAGTWRRAAVLVCLLDKDAPSLLFTQRHSGLSSHAGQVAFPGGKQNQREELKQCALREAWEETGLGAENVTVIGRLSDVVSLHGIAVTPFVGVATGTYRLTPNPGEVANIFDIPLQFLAQDPRETTDVMRFSNQHSLFIPRYRYQDYTLWGLSAMITAEFMRVGLGMDISLLNAPSFAPTRELPSVRASRYPSDYWM